MEILISILVFLVIAALVFWAVSLIPLPEPFGRIVQVILIIIFILILLGYLTGYGPHGVWIH